VWGAISGRVFIRGEKAVAGGRVRVSVSVRGVNVRVVVVALSTRLRS
jgi:hypothetical protein